VPEIPRNAEPRTGLSMGEHAALMAKDWGVGRAEQDELAAASHQHLAAAYDRGFEDDLVRVEIAPNVVVSLDRRAVAAVAAEIEEPEPEQNPEPEETLKTHESPGEAG